MFFGGFVQEHGSFEMKIQDSTLIFKCIDAWNYETALRFGDEYKKLILSFNGAPWACLVDLTQWEFTTPDVWELVDELNEWGNSKNQKYEAVVCSLIIQKVFLEKSHDLLTNVETKFCDNLEEAYSWLKSLGVLKT
jgi:hypothetical protein